MENNDIKIFADVAIVGAGLVGLAAAIALHEAGFSVVLVDSKNPNHVPQNQAVWDTRIYAISPKNVAWLSSLGVWQQLNPARIGEMQGMELWGDETETPLSLSADDIHAQGLGFIIEAGALTQALLSKVNALAIQTIFDVRSEALVVSAQQATLTLQDQSIVTQLTSNLLLATDGSHSWVREQLKFPLKQKAYAHTAVVANFKAEKSHQQIARQWFSVDDAGELKVLAWLPLPDNVISMVWSVPPTFAHDLLQLSAEGLSQKVSEAGGHLLGNLTLLNNAAAFPLLLQSTNSAMKDCVVLLGDAAHVVHPMAGQGVNLGFRDVEDLLQILHKKNPYQAINDTQLLKHYARVRKADVAKMVILTDGLFQVFSHKSGVVKKIRHWGFEATKHPYLKELLLRQAINM